MACRGRRRAVALGVAYSQGEEVSERLNRVVHQKESLEPLCASDTDPTSTSARRLRFASPHDDGMGTEAVSGAARARVDAAGEVVHFAEHLNRQTSGAQ
jgi:hypothetical protein